MIWKMINIAPALYGQSDKYIRVWLYLFNEVAKGNNRFTSKSIIDECKVTRHGLYDILNRGIDLLNKHQIIINIYRGRATDNQFELKFDISSSINQIPAVTELEDINQSQNKQPQINKKIKKEIKSEHQLAINIIITYLNDVTNKSYRTDTQSTIQLITNKLNNGFTIEQFKYVIDIKASHWLNTDMDKFLRPETLFGNKFEGYLNETINNTKQSSSVNQARIRNAEESINRDW